MTLTIAERQVAHMTRDCLGRMRSRAKRPHLACQRVNLPILLPIVSQKLK